MKTMPMKKFFGLLGAILIGLPLVLILIDAAHPKTCLGAAPPVGTLIEIPGERMEIMPSPNPNELHLSVVRDPFEIEGYQLQPAHGHIHPHQTETFAVTEGRAQVLVGTELLTLEVGETAVVPPNTLHHWMALDEQPVTVDAVFYPSAEVAEWFVHFQRHIRDDTMDLFQAAVIAREFPRGSPAPVEPPAWVWAVVSRVLAPVARLMGYKACTSA